MAEITIPDVIACDYCKKTSDEVVIFFTVFHRGLFCFCLDCYEKKLDDKTKGISHG